MTLQENKVKLSVIVPTYKVEAYIEKCIRSLEDQDLPKENYEIIVINDGSPDRCRKIVEDLQKEFSNIVLINQENRGVSMARNKGIAIAKGKYIMAIDPDDYILPNSFGSVISRALIDNLDVLYLGYDFLDQKDKLVWSTDYNKLEGQIYSGVEGYFASRGNKVRDPDRSVAILYRNGLLEKFNIAYPKNVPYLEDGLFLLKVFSVAKRVAFDADHFYIRTTRPGSATNSDLFFSDKAINGFVTAANDLREFAAKQSLNSEQAGLINHGIVKFVILPLNAAISGKNLYRYYMIVKRLSITGFKKLDTTGMPKFYLEKAHQYNFSPWYFATIYFIELALKKTRLHLN